MSKCSATGSPRSWPFDNAGRCSFRAREPSPFCGNHDPEVRKRQRASLRAWWAKRSGGPPPCRCGLAKRVAELEGALAETPENVEAMAVLLHQNDVRNLNRSWKESDREDYRETARAVLAALRVAESPCSDGRYRQEASP